MPESASRLPARPSLEQLRKQAKELHQSSGTATLADAQLALARQYGFESWPKLVHHVESVQSPGRLALFEQLAADILAGYHGDGAALERIGEYFGDSYNNEQRLVRLRHHVNSMGGVENPVLDDTRRLVARQFGFDTWKSLAESMSQPAAGSGTSAGGPPFYQIDAKRGVIEPRHPLTEADWDSIFAIMRERGINGLSAPALTDSAMARLTKLDFVTRIEIGGSRKLTDDGLLHLAAMPQLEELDLSGWYSPWTDRGLEVLRHLKSLRRFQMCWPQRVTDAGVANLSFCDHLESVDLMGTPTGDGAINALRGKRTLASFKTGKLVTDRGIPLLHDYPAFKAAKTPDVPYDLMSFGLDSHNLLLDGPITDAGLAELRGLEGVFGFGLFWHSHGFTSAGLAALVGLPNLIMLGCQGERCDDAAMRSIAAIPNLRMLMAQGTVASDDGFTALSRSRTIEHIWGRECPNLHGRGFTALAAMPSLRGLAVSCKFVDDAALAALPSFPALTWLMPMDVPDAGFRHVGRCAQLEKLTCMYCRDTGDAATEHLAGLTRLKEYYAGQTLITDRSLEVLGGIRSLEKVELSDCGGISDAGLAHLARLPKLREISVDGSARVTRAGVGVFPASVHVNFWG